MSNTETAMSTTRCILVTAVVFVVGGCNEAFEPKGEFQEEYVVFAILTSVRDTQFIRFYKTYDPPAFNPLEYSTENSVTGAAIQISNGSTVYAFRETTLVRADRSRYQNDIQAYVAHPFPVERGETYTLSVQTGSGDDIEAELTVPGEAALTIGNIAAFRSPTAFRNGFITLFSALSPATFGFQVRAFLEYDLRENGVFVRKREELPTAVRDRLNCQEFRPLFHTLQRRRQLQPDLTTFDVLAYTTMLAKVWNTYSPFDVRMRQVVFELTEFDPALYAYLNTVNGFRDEFSIRTDEPDFSNIPGGRGIFGAMTKQSIAVSLPDTVGVTFLCN